MTVLVQQQFQSKDGVTFVRQISGFQVEQVHLSPDNATAAAHNS